MGGQEIWTWSLPGPNNSTFNLSATIDKDKLINTLTVHQMTPPSPTALQTPPPFCRKFTLTDAQFLGLLQAIVNHGDETDIAFMEKTLGTKLSQTAADGEDGKPDPDQTDYQSDHLLGSPIPVAIDIFRGKDSNEMGGEKARMRLGGPNSDFYFHCLKLTMTDFFSSFSRKNLSIASIDGPYGDAGDYVWKLYIPGKNDVALEMHVSWTYDGGDNDLTRFNYQHQIVTSVDISQSPH